MNIKSKLKKMFRKTRSLNGIREINYKDTMNLLKSNTNSILVDVRSNQEFAENRINGAINIPLFDLEKKANSILPNKNATIILCCKSGERSKKAYKMLTKMGYRNLYNLKGGLDGLS